MYVPGLKCLRILLGQNSCFFLVEPFFFEDLENCFDRLQLLEITITGKRVGFHSPADLFVIPIRSKNSEII